MSDQARSIIETVFSFSKKGKITHPTIDIQDQVPFYIKEVKITPYTVDHSAYRSIYVPNRGRRQKGTIYTAIIEITDINGKLFKPTLRKIRQDRHTNHRTALLYQDHQAKHKQRQN